MDEFYVTLPSNVKGVKENTIGNFTTYLPSELVLDYDWKVAVTEIFYTNSWFNLKKNNFVAINERNNDGGGHLLPIPGYGVTIMAGRYESLDELLSLINDYFLNNDGYEERQDGLTKDLPNHPKHEKPYLSHDRYTRLVTQSIHTIQGTRRYMETEFQEELGQLLGMEKGREFSNAKFSSWYNFGNADKSMAQQLYAKRCYDMSGGIHSLYVYSDVVDYSHVGDTKCQLLRVVEIPSNSRYGDHVHITYQTPYYLPLANRNISSIEIDIKDDSGEPIDFKFGRVEVVLHFKKE